MTKTSLIPKGEDIWSLSYYKDSLKEFIEAGYTLGTFEAFLKNKPTKFVALRHDIDFNPDLLDAMLKVEEELGLNSSVFFRVCAKNYNILSFGILDLLQEIQSRGHEVGLHLDVDLPHGTSMTKEDFATFQKEIIERIVGRTIRGFSLHYPATNQEYSFADHMMQIWNIPYHTYNQLFFRDFKYLSDSGGRWREGHFRDWINKSNYIQVLTHPIWHYKRTIQDNF